jgi:primosomal protein N' (replication factor Y)
MSKLSFSVVQVVIQASLRSVFDYFLPETISSSLNLIGKRVLVPFGRKQQIGIIVAVDQQSSIPVEKLKTIDEIIDTESIFTSKIFELLQWASRYYHHPLGEVLFTALPQSLRQGEALSNEQKKFWRLSSSFDAAMIKKLTPKQKAVVQLLGDHELGLNALVLREYGIKDLTLRSLGEKNIIEPYVAFLDPTIKSRDDEESEMQDSLRNDEEGKAQSKLREDEDSKKDFFIESQELGVNLKSVLALTDEQQFAIDTISQQSQFSVFVLQGVTGSGKTEVYLQLIEKTLAAGKQALVLVPEIGLTPQTVARFQQRFAVPITIMHSNLSETERSKAWQDAYFDHAKIVIGTRSAIFAPLKHLGIIVLDEEHDLSFKQQSSFRYNARDLAVRRAQLENVPIVLGSATPSLETYYNLSKQHYKVLSLTKRVADAQMPKFQLIDMKQHFHPDGLAPQTVTLMREHLAQNQQVLVFLNRRGYAPLLMCHACGWIAECKRCDAKFTLHRHPRRLQCHHCDASQQIPGQCPNCQQSALFELGFGTQRIEETIKNLFPETDLIRIDRDTTRRKGSFENLLTKITEEKPQILVGTQMLAKGHHFPNVTLVVIVNVDQGLHSLDFRATERMAQLIIQVAGRAGRANKAGLVVLQTHTPEHPLLQMLLQQGYLPFLDQTLQERKIAQWPPYSHLALIRAEANNNQLPFDFLSEAYVHRKKLTALGIDLMGPIPSPMERKAGHYRAQLLVQSKQRSSLHTGLSLLIETLTASKKSRKVRWSLDVDPQEMD